MITITGKEVWLWCITLRDMIIQCVNTFYGALTIRLGATLENALEITGDNIFTDVIKNTVLLFLNMIGDPTLLELMFGVISIVVTVVLLNWIVDIIPI